MTEFEKGIGVGYTLATGKLYCSMVEFQQWAEELLGRPIWTHDFADRGLWDELREAYEERALAILKVENPA